MDFPYLDYYYYMLPEEKMDFLIRQIRYYNYAYHIRGENVMTNEQYDAYRQELEDLERDYPDLVKMDSPTFSIGIVDSREKLIKHKTPMLSLKSTYDLTDLKRFLEIKEDLIIEPKIDGVALSINYVDGFIDSICLRGDGKEGEDMTHHAPFLNIPLKIDHKGYITIRGELVTEQKIANSRNIVAGFLRRKQASDFNLKFYAYTLIKNHMEEKTHMEALEYLKACGFQTVEYILCKQKENFINDTIKKVEEIINKDYEFIIDGAVLKVNNLAKALEMGFSFRHPKSMLAFKTCSSIVSSKILSIEWGLNRMGYLIPTALIEPVILDSEIKRIFLHNKRNIQENFINIGSKIKIFKAGNVIPALHSVENQESPLMIKNCPFCDHILEETEINYICNNINCEELQFQSVFYFFKNLKTDCISEKFLKELMKNHHIKRKNTNLEISLEAISLDLILQISEVLWGDSWTKTLNHQKIKKNLKKVDLYTFLAALGVKGFSYASIIKSNLKELDEISYDNIDIQKNSEISLKIPEELKRFYYTNKNLIKKIANWWLI